MQSLIRSFALLVVIALVSMPVFSASNEIKQVNAKHICFVEKKRFDRTLKSVKIDGKTYYGCCADCLDTLKNSPKSRIEIDPVSGKEVDKADAVIGVDKNGTVYFFENLENMKRFRAPAPEIPTGER